MKELHQSKWKNTTWSSRHNTENRSEAYTKYIYKEEIIFMGQEDIAHYKKNLNQKENNS